MRSLDDVIQCQLFAEMLIDICKRQSQIFVIADGGLYGCIGDGVSVVPCDRNQNLTDQISNRSPVARFFLFAFFTDFKKQFTDLFGMRIVTSQAVLELGASVEEYIERRICVGDPVGGEQSRGKMYVKKLHAVVTRIRCDVRDAVVLVCGIKKNITGTYVVIPIFGTVDTGA